MRMLGCEYGQKSIFIAKQHDSLPLASRRDIGFERADI